MKKIVSIYGSICSFALMQKNQKIKAKGMAHAFGLTRSPICPAIAQQSFIADPAIPPFLPSCCFISYCFYTGKGFIVLEVPAQGRDDSAGSMIKGNNKRRVEKNRRKSYGKRRVANSSPPSAVIPALSRDLLHLSSF